MTDNERKIFEKISREVDTHLKECCFVTDKSSWYTGITNNVNQRFGNHKKNKEIMYFKAWDATNFEVARALEFFHSKLGFGNSDNLGNAGKDAKYFYVFKKNLGIGDSLLNAFRINYNEKKPKEVKISTSKTKKK